MKKWKFIKGKWHFVCKDKLYSWTKFNDSPDDASEYLRDIFSGKTPNYEEYVLIHQGLETKKCSPLYMKSRDYRQHCFEYFYFANLVFTPNTYRADKDGKVTAKDSSMNRLRVWGIDIDYKKNQKYKKIAPENFYEFIAQELSDFAPLPNWIECGHQLRLIYILDEEVYTKNSPELVRGIKAVAKKICNELNRKFCCFAEPQKAWYRVPGSVNMKDGSIIRVHKASSCKYSVQELLDEYMPVLPMNKEEWKEVKKEKKSRKGYRNHGLKDVYEARMSDFEYLAANSNNVPREKLCFLWASQWCLLYPEKTDQMMDQVLSFNQMFDRPLPEKELRSKLRTLPDLMKKTPYLYRNATIMEELSIDDEYCKKNGLYLRSSAADRREYNKREKNHAKRYEDVRLLMEQDPEMGARRIAGFLPYSVSTVQRYMREVREDWKIEKWEHRALRKIRLHVNHMLKPATKSYETVFENETISNNNANDFSSYAGKCHGREPPHIRCNTDIRGPTGLLESNKKTYPCSLCVDHMEMFIGKPAA